MGPHSGVPDRTPFARAGTEAEKAKRQQGGGVKELNALKFYSELSNDAKALLKARLVRRTLSRGKTVIEKGRTVPEFEKVAFETPKGQIAEPVKSRFAQSDPNVFMIGRNCCSRSPQKQPCS